MIWTISYGSYDMAHIIWVMWYLIPFERYASIPFCDPYFLVGRNLGNQRDRLYETDWSANSEIPVKAWMKRKLISRMKMTSSSVFLSIAIKHFLPRLGKNILRKVLVLVIKRVTKTDTISASISFYARVQRFDYISRWLFLIKIHPDLYTLQVYRFNLRLRFRVREYIWLFFVPEIRNHQIN